MNQAKSKNYIEQHIYDKQHVPAPTDNQPAHGKFAHSIARRTSTSHMPHAGKFNSAKSKNYMEQHVHDKQFMPSPGANQPKHGFSTLADTGGGFNMSKPKNYIEQHIHDKKHVPAPTDNQPAHGKFAHSIARRTSVSLHPHAGRMNQAKSKNYINQHLHEKKDVPAPTDNQPAHGKFAHSIARKTSVSLHPHAGRMAQSKSKN